MKIRFPQSVDKGENQEAGARAALPLNFSPIDYPILCRHWFNVEPFRPVGELAAEVVADLRFRNKMTVLLAMSDRPVAEMVAEFAVRHGLEAELDQVLDRYLEIPDGALDVTSGRALSPLPLHEVGP